MWSKIWKNKSVILLGLPFLIFTGCEWFKFKQDVELTDPDAKPVVRVNNKFLYHDDLKEVIGDNLSPQDSVKRAASYIKNWSKKQLIIAKAEKELNLDQTEIERKILDYRYALIAHEFEKDYVDKNLDTVISENEISTYYEKKKDNFILKQNIFKGDFVKLPRDAPKMGRFRGLLNSSKPESREELKSYCIQFALNYSLDADEWLRFDEIIVNSPLQSVANKAQFLKNYKQYESRDDKGVYFLRVNEYKVADEVSPMEFVKDQIKGSILHKRKVDLIKMLEDEIYDKANENDEIEIFVQ